MSVLTSTEHVMPTYARWPVEFVSGRGATLTAVDGGTYIDLVAGIAVASVGHAHPAIATAIAEQAAQLVHVSNLYITQPQLELARQLAEISGGKQSFFCNSGAEAIEAALKLARRWAGNARSGATRIVVAEGGFHGRTLGALSATGQPSKRVAFEPLVPGFIHVPFGDIDALTDAIADDVVAVLLEPIQGEAGVIVPPDDYLPSVADACRTAGILLILDEIQTGLGRTGRWFAAEHWGVDADVVCLAKALGGGLPIGACLAHAEIAFRPGDHASTFGGGPVQCAAALATLEVIRTEGLLERAEIAGQMLQDRLRAIVGGRGVVRGKGLMLAIEFPGPVARRVAERAFDGGVLVNDATPNVIRLVPPLVFADDEIEKAVTVLEGAIDAI
ncbi:MAG: acetylornithine transaminase [Actinomycetota bacterium]|nr:acetylornithine transaminase [Actinomycetota bacterium]